MFQNAERRTTDERDTDHQIGFRHFLIRGFCRFTADRFQAVLQISGAGEKVHRENDRNGRAVHMGYPRRRKFSRLPTGRSLHRKRENI